MPMTLKDFHLERVAKLESRQSEAQASLNTHIQNLSPAQEDLREKLSELARIADDIAETRQRMAGAPLPSDAEALAETLRDQIIVQRQRRAARLDAEQALDEVERSKAMASVALANAETELKTAKAELASAEKRANRHAAWATALTEEPLLGLPAAATAAQGGADFAAAEARVTGIGADLPVKLRTRAQERRTRELERQAELGDLVTNATSEHDDQRKSDAGVEGATHELWTAFLAAEDAFGDYVLRAKQRFDQALFDLEKIKDSLPLTPEQQSRLTDAALEAAREEAVDAERVRDDALKLVEEKGVELAKARLVVKKGDVDLDQAGVDADPTVDTILTALNTLKGDLTTKEAALDAVTPPDPSHRRQLDLWEAAAPEHLWGNLGAFEEAKSTLGGLASGPGTLAADMTSAEDALATALATSDKSERTRDHLVAAIGEHQAALDFAASAAKARIASQVRGDQ